MDEEKHAPRHSKSKTDLKRNHRDKKERSEDHKYKHRERGRHGDKDEVSYKEKDKEHRERKLRKEDKEIGRDNGKEKKHRELDRDVDRRDHDRKCRKREEENKDRECEQGHDRKCRKREEENKDREREQGQDRKCRKREEENKGECEQDRSHRHENQDDDQRRKKHKEIGFEKKEAKTREEKLGRGKNDDNEKKSRELDRDVDDDRRDHDRKRQKREEDYKEREREESRSLRLKNEDVDRRRKKHEENDLGKKRGKTREEELEEDQRKLEEEMDKRRRRVQEWQEMKRKREELENGMAGKEKLDEVVSSRKWNLEGESDDDEASPMLNTDDGVKHDFTNTQELHTENRNELANGDEDIDPLDAFMNTMVLPEVDKLNNMETNDVSRSFESVKDGQVNGDQTKKATSKSIGRMIPGEDSDSDYGDLEDDEVPLDEDDDAFMKRLKKTKVEKLALVDHSKIKYPPFRKNFYIEVKGIFRMTTEEVATYRKQLELIIHGKNVPKPIQTWTQIGLTSKVLDIIKKLEFEKPMPIQAQALPIIMSGRDCIGIASTGSGKTLAFVLPMLRHIKDQPPLVAGDGPIGLVIAPTRELVLQIDSDIKKFAKMMGLRCVAVYGGAGIAQQISDLKQGAEIVVCCPARMIDMLSKGSGKITNLRRVTYLVMDEADRMFDMGFGEQITPIIQNIRPDRQTVLFSATFPRPVEIMARKVLTNPVEIQDGGRSVVNKDITQLVEVRPESVRFQRLLELLGEWYEKGKILIFVQSQEKCDNLFKDLIKSCYPCLSLHGAQEQTDRACTISDFKKNICSVLVATSIAARGLDVKDLELVINYDAPTHYEDYVHRVGRTGRAGKQGCAITFISEEDARYAPDLVKALKQSEQAVPDDLKCLADGFMAKVNQGLEKVHGTGYGGSGFKFNEEEDEVKKAAKKALKREYGFEEDSSDSNSEDEIIPNSRVELPQCAPLVTQRLNDGAVRFAERLAVIRADSMADHCIDELEINDLPQNVRYKLTHRDTRGPISELTGASITPKGQYYPPGKNPGPGERKLHLFIEGSTKVAVKQAKTEVKRVLEEIIAQSSVFGTTQSGKFSVL